MLDSQGAMPSTFDWVIPEPLYSSGFLGKVDMRGSSSRDTRYGLQMTCLRLQNCYRSKEGGGGTVIAEGCMIRLVDMIDGKSTATKSR